MNTLFCRPPYKVRASLALLSGDFRTVLLRKDLVFSTNYFVTHSCTFLSTNALNDSINDVIALVHSAQCRQKFRLLFFKITDTDACSSHYANEAA